MPHANAGVPVAADLHADLGAQPAPDEPDPSWADSVYVTGWVHSGEHHFAVLIHILNKPATGAQHQTVSITDEADGSFKTYDTLVPAGRLSWKRGHLDIQTPDVRWAGDAVRQKVVATATWGSLALDLEAEGPPLYYAGTGTFALLGYPQYEYALPRMRTSGRLTVNGRTYSVTGESWVDRQWGAVPDPRTFRWTWMNMIMPGGDKLAIWNPRSLGRPSYEECWATILHADGTHEVVPVIPLGQGAGGPWVSPTSGQVFPTRWQVSIPARQTTLTVVASPLAQEVPSLGGRFEGTASFTGTYLGRPVTGRTYVEQTGNWHP